MNKNSFPHLIKYKKYCLNNYKSTKYDLYDKLLKTFSSINVDFEISLSILVFAKNNLLKC